MSQYFFLFFSGQKLRSGSIIKVQLIEEKKKPLTVNEYGLFQTPNTTENEKCSEGLNTWVLVWIITDASLVSLFFSLCLFCPSGKGQVYSR